MERTRRYWTTVSLGGLLAAGAVVLARPALFSGAALLWGWLLAHQYTFVRRFDAALDALSISVASTRSRVATETTTVVTMQTTLDRDPGVDLRATARLPVGATAVARDQRSLAVATDGTAETAFAVEWPIAGTFEIGPPLVTGTDRYGLFRHRVALDAATAVTVDPRHARDVHVGQGSDEIAAGYGEHDAGRYGGGLETAEIRKYIPGDEARQIDWKTTARLNELHVREQEPMTNRVVSLIVDHRSELGDGPDGHTKLDYLRHVALAFVDTAQEFDDAIGIYGIGNEGLTTQIAPRAEQGTYEELRTSIRELTPTAASDRSAPSARATAPAPTTPPAPAHVRRIATRLDGDTSAFGRTLTPFFEDAATYVRRIDDDPLFRIMRQRVHHQSEATWTVVFTDDTHRTELQEALKVARRGDKQVMVFLTPSVCFEQDGLPDPETAYERYVEFEEFRRRLARMDRVTAFEVAPGDKLDAVLAGNPRADRSRTDRSIASDTDTDDTGPARTTN